MDDEKWDEKYVAIELGSGDRVVGCLRKHSVGK